MNSETRQRVIDLLNDWGDDLAEIFDRTERPNWDTTAETLKAMFCATVDEVLEDSKEEYGYFD